MKKLYHGSVSDFDVIDLSQGKGYKDFGKGFYATAVKEHAERLAIRNKGILIKRQKVLRERNPKLKLEQPMAYCYNLLYDDEVENLKTKVFRTADAEWLRFIVANRKSPVSVHDFDIVIGPTADAQTTTIINENMEELEQSNFSEEVCNKVITELQPENLPKQYFFGTNKALKTLEFDRVKRKVIP
ncbi:MAG: DUF3990 domain-containing protein [Roseburia sp.]|uniref:DUF3990 domain-containing protein n=1 Tax=Roseburia sp. 831b TaxID=1261635 RepID=UPI0009524B39|nr:DUF3990 domain-containing protein [Roseburia sp. 831b]MDD6217496.1 DUF3990 domain-containing protein [Roseburia sp.]WVK72746.1 DUF3990 domain-containing protein [Roseburia sp. 831b]